MKRFIAILLALVMCLGLCACNGAEVGETIENKFIVIENVTYSDKVVYHQDTLIVYFLDNDSYGGYLTPYQIYENGAIYGAVYENGEIVPVPYALGVTPEMLESQIGSWFN